MAGEIDSYIPFFGRDFLASTALWSAEEVGHYIRLLIIQWDHGHLPNQIQRIERVSPGVGSVWDVVGEKFPVCDDGFRRNMRMEEHRQKAIELKASRAAAGRKGASTRWRNGKANGPANGKANCPAIALPMANDMAEEWHPSPSPNPSPNTKETPTPTSNGATTKASSKPAESSASSDFVSDDPRECWEAFRDAWTACKRAAPLGTALNAIDPPRAYLDLWRAGDAKAALAALGQLGECRFFEKPISLSQFLNVWPKIEAGGYRDRKGATSSKADDKPPPERWLDNYQPSNYRRPREVLELASKMKRAE